MPTSVGSVYSILRNDIFNRKRQSSQAFCSLNSQDFGSSRFTDFPSSFFVLDILLGEGDPPTAEAAALSLPSIDENFALGIFDQLQKHEKIQFGKIGEKYSFVSSWLQ